MSAEPESGTTSSKLRTIMQVAAAVLFVLSAGMGAASYKTQSGFWAIWVGVAAGFALTMLFLGTKKTVVVLIVAITGVISVVGINASSVSENVNPIWSAEHKRQKWINEAKTDLRVLSAADPLLTSNNLDAWARLGSLEKTVTDSAAMTQKYAGQVDSGKIDGMLVEAGKAMVLASSATKVAAESKIADLKTGDESSNSKAAKAYEDYVAALVNADQKLSEVSDESR